jgi:hypothetical protein
MNEYQRNIEASLEKKMNNLFSFSRLKNIRLFYPTGVKHR